MTRKIEDELPPRFVVYACDINGEPRDCVGQYHTISEVFARKKRLDQILKVQVGGYYLSWNQFVTWGRAQIEQGTQIAREAKG
jgi:hypothetical protein